MKYKINRNILHLLSVSIISLCCVGIISAQESNKLTENSDKTKEIEKKATAMLFSLINDVDNLKLPENRIIVFMLIVDMLWKSDEAKARELMNEAVKTFNATLSNNDNDDDNNTEINNSRYLFELRREIIQSIAKHDPDFALDFLASSKALLENIPGYRKDNEQHLESTIAQLVSQSNPKRAFQLAKEHLTTTGNLSQIQGMIYSLHQKDPESSRQLIDLVINQVKTNNQSNDQSMYFIMNLLRSLPLPSNQTSTIDDTKTLISRKQAKELSEVLIKAMQTQLSGSKSQSGNDTGSRQFFMNNNFADIRKYITTFTPESIESFDKIKIESDKIMNLVNPNQKRWHEFQEASKNSTAEKLIELAKNAPPDMKYSYYDQAINKLLNEGNVEQARKIANEQITNPGQRDSALRSIDSQLLHKNIQEKKFDDARSAIRNMRTKAEKVKAYIQIAQNLKTAKDKSLAEEFLNEAYALVSGPPTSSTQLQSQMIIASAFADITPNRSFEIVEMSIDKCNELLEAAVILGEFERRGTVRNGEIVGLGNRQAGNFQQYLQALPALFVSDSDRMELLITRINRNDVRTMARLVLLQQLFTGDNSINRSMPGDRPGVKISPTFQLNRRIN